MLGRIASLAQEAEDALLAVPYPVDAELLRATRRLHALTSIISTTVLLFAFSFVGLIAYAIVSAVLEVSSSFKF